MVPRPYRIRSVLRETVGGDVFTWEMMPVEGEAMTFAPGQFNMLYQLGIGEVPISISGDPQGGSLVHTLRAVGGVTQAMADLGIGDVVGVRGPFGSRWPAAEAEGGDLVVVAGGIGLAPLRPVIYHALANRDRYRRVYVFYGAREPQAMIFRAELEQWRESAELTLAMTVDRSADGWSGNVGVVTRLIDRTALDPERCTAMLCGPEVMMRYAALSLSRQGMDASRIWLSMERNMKCALGYCGHCQLGPHFVCKDGPVFTLDRIQPLMDVREL
jgi:NAD(P)H-flavin reductase